MPIILSGHSLVDSLEIGDEELTEISQILALRRNFSMSIYKDKCMKRRIAIRMRSCRCHDATEYCNLLRQSDQELDQLQKTLTIHVSQFFRNPSMFEKLQAEIIPYLLHKAETGQTPLRCGSFGCAGGEEAYSLAIILRSYFVQDIKKKPVEIRAYDIDPGILQAAIQAEYNEDRLKDLPQLFKEHYFIPNGPRLQLSPEIRAMVSFFQHNIMDVELLEPCQLALCRNTLIYFTRPDQEKILHGIAHIMPTDGILVLGKSETLVGDVRKLFATVCPVERIYRRL